MGLMLRSEMFSARRPFILSHPVHFCGSRRGFCLFCCKWPRRGTPSRKKWRSVPRICSEPALREAVIPIRWWKWSIGACILPLPRRSIPLPRMACSPLFGRPFDRLGRHFDQLGRPPFTRIPLAAPRPVSLTATLIVVIGYGFHGKSGNVRLAPLGRTQL